jgi:hypothetical protein
VSDLDPEDAKILTLARATRARAGTADGAAVRDLDGRTYAAASVDLPSLRLSALQVAVAMAVSSGAAGLEAAAVVGEGDPTCADLAAVRDLGGAGTPVLVAGSDGSLRGTSQV